MLEEPPLSALSHAIAVNVEIMRAFVRLREMGATNKELTKKLEESSRRAGILEAIPELMRPPKSSKKRRIRFT